MADIDLLDEAIKESGLRVDAVLEKAHIPKHTYYRRRKAPDTFTQAEICGLSQALGLAAKKRDQIFLP